MQCGTNNYYASPDLKTRSQYHIVTCHSRQSHQAEGCSAAMCADRDSVDTHHVGIAGCCLALLLHACDKSVCSHATELAILQAAVTHLRSSAQMHTRSDQCIHNTREHTILHMKQEQMQKPSTAHSIHHMIQRYATHGSIVLHVVVPVPCLCWHPACDMKLLKMYMLHLARAGTFVLRCL